MENDQFYMRQAINKARHGIEEFEYPFGCCIVTDHNNDNIVVSAANTCFSEKNPIMHAEINAIRELCKVLDKTTLEDAVIFTTIEPCIMCMGAISWARIPRLVFGLSLNHSLKYGFEEVNLSSTEIASYFPYKIKIEGGLLVDECESLFSDWKDKNRVLHWLKRAKKVKGQY